MSIKKWLKFILAIIILGTGCFGLVLYENNYIATVGAHSASILLPTYAVGTEYNGEITKQYVSVGDAVKVGQRLFELKSDQLSAEVATGDLKVSNLTYQTASDGGFIITASQNGVISQINTPSGSFVNAGSTIAEITGVSGVSVRSNFELSSPEYAKVQPSTPLLVSLGGATYHATITGITQQSANGYTYTVITASLPTISTDQTIYTNGTPVSTKLVLNSSPLYQRIEGDIRSHKSIRL
jgi:multidrug efflux pump subunit AcrA (membrane-fusion protein)